MYDRAYSFLLIMDEFLKQIIREAGEIAKTYFFNGVTVKSKSHAIDFVTEADIAVSKFLVQKIHEKYPTHHIKSEELETDVNAENLEYEWVIDPIDGTRNFSFGIPVWAVMITVMKNDVSYLAAVYHPTSNALFFAEKGKGAFLNDKKISVNNSDTLERGYGNMFRCIPFGPYGDFFEKYKRGLAHMALDTNASIVNFGCAGMLCYVAKGNMDFAIGNAGLDWDLLPNFLICEEAGAKITNSSGEPWTRGRQDYVIANPIVHPKVLEILNDV